jgi:hypothetical protein
MKMVIEVGHLHIIPGLWLTTPLHSEARTAAIQSSRGPRKTGNISRHNLMTGAAASACYPPPPRAARAQVELDVHDPPARLKAFGKQRLRHEPTM